MLKTLKNTLALTVLMISTSLFASETTMVQTLYYGGDIVTMKGNTAAEAVMVKDTKIIYVGEKAAAVNNFAGKTIEIDLKGKTMQAGISTDAAKQFKIKSEAGLIKRGEVANFTVLQGKKVAWIIVKGKLQMHDKHKMPGSDVDSHGCKASAGFSWCGKTNQCERPWELAKKENFKNDNASFNSFCKNMQGADIDAHGCKASTGFSWCGKTNQCERPWELAKKENFKNDNASFNVFCKNK